MLVLALALGLVASTWDGALQLHFLNIKKYPTAVCNDGTPGAYYVRSANTSRWVVHQQGGFWCWDSFSCHHRWEHFEDPTHRDPTERRHLMSSKHFNNETLNGEPWCQAQGQATCGILSPDSTRNPDFAAASKAFVAYCSSDSHTGDTVSPPYHFRGRAILRAVLQELTETHGLRDVRDLILTGDSAGGMAVLTNADYVFQYLTETLHLPTTLNYLALADAGYFRDVEPFTNCSHEGYECGCVPLGHDPVSLAEQMQKGIKYWGGTPGADCSAFYGEFGAWRCYLGQYAAPFVASPTLLTQNQADEWQMNWNGDWQHPNYTSPEARYARWFRASTARWLRSNAQEQHSAGRRFGVFSPNCWMHDIDASTSFWNVNIGGRTAQQTVSDALFGNKFTVVIDDCEAFDCTIGC